MIDSKHIHAALVNLVTNAIDACFNDPEEKRHVVTMSLKINPETVQFQVMDNGTGIDENMQERLFNAFNSTKGSGGTGLGLFMSQKIAKEHGGKITVESKPGKGSTFALYIPREPPIKSLSQNP